MAGFSKSEAIKFGWEITKKNIYFFIKVFILTGGILLGLSFLNGFFRNIPFLNLFFSLFITALQIIFSLGFMKIALKFYDNEKPEISDIFSQYPLFLKYLLATILSVIIVTLGLILFIVPGIIFAIRFWFFGYFIVDKNLGAIESLKKSWEITKGNTWNLFIFLILLALINILGFLALVIGLLLSVPTTLLAQAFVYRKLSENLQLKNQVN